MAVGVITMVAGIAAGGGAASAAQSGAHSADAFSVTAGAARP